MLWQRAACLAHCTGGIKRRGRPSLSQPIGFTFPFWGFAAIYVRPGDATGGAGGRPKDKEAKSPVAYSRGLTGLGCRYNAKPVSKAAVPCPAPVLFAARLESWIFETPGG